MLVKSEKQLLPTMKPTTQHLVNIVKSANYDIKETARILCDAFPKAKVSHNESYTTVTYGGTKVSFGDSVITHLIYGYVAFIIPRMNVVMLMDKTYTFDGKPATILPRFNCALFCANQIIYGYIDPSFHHLPISNDRVAVRSYAICSDEFQRYLTLNKHAVTTQTITMTRNGVTLAVANDKRSCLVIIEEHSLMSRSQNLHSMINVGEYLATMMNQCVHMAGMKTI